MLQCDVRRLVLAQATLRQPPAPVPALPAAPPPEAIMTRDETAPALTE